MFQYLPKLKLYLDICDGSDDSLLLMLIEQAESFIESYCGRKFIAEDFSELYTGKGEKEFIIKNIPINSITSFQYNSGTFGSPVWEDFDEDFFRPDLAKGIIYLAGNLPRGPQNIQIIYNAGFLEIPKDLENAIIRLSAYWYNGRNADGIKSESVDGASISYDKKEIPTGIYNILDSYKLR